MKVRAKKRLGQHFLNDEGIAHRIVESLLEMDPRGAECSVLEVGPGMGVLTKYLLQEDGLDFRAVEIDEESVRENIPRQARGHRQFPLQHLLPDIFQNPRP